VIRSDFARRRAKKVSRGKAGETLGPGLLRSILNQAGISAEELRDVL